MNKAKKLVIFCVAIFIIVFIYLVFLFGFNKPLEGVTGCYSQDDIEPYDRVCIDDGGWLGSVLIPIAVSFANTPLAI